MILHQIWSNILSNILRTEKVKRVDDNKDDFIGYPVLQNLELKFVSA